ncbi:MAG TPA: EAL domain-containing protein [Baekduia sp.]|uniref:EAL domain-containing protein n=1 Tax=Baekduia sp. TaxID=2600305 RepID=UPI002B9F94A3|nr:EAL domain-containing protein [Baekduia sp.]HMJ37083.1 EAL domain-containing protein [Baekduia sp.]
MPSPHARTPETLAEERTLALADLLRQATQASLDPVAVLEVIVRWCARVLGDQADVRTLSRDQTMLEPGPHAHRDPRSESLAHEVGAHMRPADSEPRAAHVLRTQEPLLVAVVQAADVDGGRYARYVAEVGITSLIAVPLVSRGRALGVLTLTRDRGRPPYTEADLAVAVEVGSRIGLIFDNARLYERVRVHSATLEHVDAAVCATDAAGAITAFNPAAERMFGWPESEALGRSPVDLLSAEPPERIAAAREAVLRDGRCATEWRLRRRDGSLFDGHVHTVVVRDDDGRLTGMVAVYQDLSERLRLIGQLERRAAQQAAVATLGERALEAEDPATLIDRAVEAVRTVLRVELSALFELIDDGRALLLRAGAGFGDGLVRHATVPAGWGDSQEGFTLIRREPVIVDNARTERRFIQADLVAREGAVSGVTVVVQGRGGPHAVLAAYSASSGAFAPDDVTFLQAMANVLGDALDRFASDEEIRRRGLHDPLTELPNRTLIMDRLQQAVQRADRADGHVALVFLDLDHFKLVNDSLGHRAGDEVLRQVADRLRGAVRPTDTVGRIGGDEFVVLCEDVADEAMALAIAERLSAAFGAPFGAGGDEHVLGASIGIALLDPEQDPEELLRDADAAMYRAKEGGRARIELFDTGMRAWADGRLQIEAALRRALEGDELEVHYQPIVDLADGSIAALEALVRWRHPERGLLAPDAFIPVAEESGLIVGVGRRVLELACAQAAAWAALRPGRPPLPVHVNLSPRQLHDQSLVETVQATLQATGAVPAALALEITESTLIDRGPARLALLERLRDLGVELQLDDFGTGWSSLSYLAQLPIGGLKIDRSFVAGLDTGHAPIVDAIVRLARAFALPVVAEGVETADQLAALRRLGCGLGQGYLFSRPLPAEELRWLVAATEPPFAARADAA